MLYGITYMYSPLYVYIYIYIHAYFDSPTLCSPYIFSVICSSFALWLFNPQRHRSFNASPITILGSCRTSLTSVARNFVDQFQNSNIAHVLPAGVEPKSMLRCSIQSNMLRVFEISEKYIIYTYNHIFIYIYMIIYIYNIYIYEI